MFIHPVEFASPMLGPRDNAEEQSIKQGLHQSQHTDCLLSKTGTGKLR